MFGKEALLSKKIGLTVIAIFCALNLYSLSISANSSSWKNYSREQLLGLSYDIPAGNGESKRGISLDELFPALYDAWSLEIESADGLFELSSDNLAGELPGLFIITDSDSLSLEFDGRLYRGISSLNITGEILSDRPLEIWVNWEGTELLKQEINRYADLHELEIKITEVPRPDSKLISVTRGGGRVPDVIMVQSSYIDSLVRSGSIQNIDYMYPEGLQSQGREAFTHSGKTWAVPFYYDTQLLFYNPNLIRGPENNWDLADFEHFCGIAKTADVIPSAWNAYSASFLIPFQMSFGKQKLIEENGSIDITDEASINALEYIIRLKDRGLMAPMERDAMISLFVSSEAAMIISASYSIPHFESLGIPFRAVALPINQETGRRISPLLDFKAFAVTKKSGNTIGARRLIEYLSGTGVQQRFSSEVSKLPARESILQLLEGRNPYFEALKLSAGSGVIIPTDKAYSIYKNTMWKMLRFAISGRMPPRQVLEKTQDLIDKNLY